MFQRGNLAKKLWPKILTPSFFYSDFYLHFLRPCYENILKIVSKVLRKVENKSHNLTLCFSLQPTIVYNFSEIKSTFSAPF